MRGGCSVRAICTKSEWRSKITSPPKRNGGRYPNAWSSQAFTPERPSIAKALTGFTEDNAAVFLSPDDEQYFPREGVSDEYPAMRLADKTRQQSLVR